MLRAMSNRAPRARRLVDLILDALNGHDRETLHAIVHPDYSLRVRSGILEGRSYSGPDGVRDYLRDIDEGFVNTDWVLEELRTTLPSGSVFVSFRFTARARTTKVPVSRLVAQIWSFRDDRIWRNVSYESRADALTAAWLAE